MLGKSAFHFVYFWSCKTLPYTHLEATSYIPQQGESLHIWATSLSTTGCNKNKYTVQLLWTACISRFATAILSVETELAFGIIRVDSNFVKGLLTKLQKLIFIITQMKKEGAMTPLRLQDHWMTVLPTCLNRFFYTWPGCHRAYKLYAKYCHI